MSATSVRRLLFGAALSLTALAGCQSDANKTAQAAESARPDLLRAALDTTIHPGDDFFTYANGTWLKNHPIPASENGWTIAKEVQNEIYARLRSTSEAAAKAKATPGSVEQQIGDFWAAGMDSVKADQLGAKPLQPELDFIRSLKTAADVPSAMARLVPLGVRTVIGPRVEQDAKHSDQMALYLYQSGLGLPNRDYYFNADSRTKNIRVEYVKHIANTFRLLGQDAATAQTSADHLMQLETALAKASRKLEDLRDPYANYHKLDLAALGRLTPGLDWRALLTQMEIKGVDSVIVGQPEFFQAFGKLLKTTPLPDWQAYLQWQLVRTYAPTLSRDFVAENFHFYGTVLGGATQPRPRWKRVLDMQEDALGFALGKLFVQDYFKPEAKARYEQMTENVVQAFREHIQRLDWMSDTTKRVALTKLNAIRRKVGYPDKWRSYAGLEIGRSSLAENVMNANRFDYRYRLNKLGKPVDRDQWDMTPQTYNAYYNPSNNEIVLPAAIFAIPGLPDAEADDALVYGYGGASTIGHELTHGFDDEGSQFDAKGNLHEWWTKADRRRFQQRVAAIVRQFNSYTVLDSLHINGKATAGENIADLGGVVIALDAYKKTDEYKRNQKLGGLTPTQRYFLGYSLGWQGHQRDESLAARILSDVHSPPQFRVNGPFADVPAFYEAFAVQPTHKLFRPDTARVVIW